MIRWFNKVHVVCLTAKNAVHFLWVSTTPLKNMRDARGCQLGRDRFVRIETHAGKPLAEKLPTNYYHTTKINMKNSKNYKQNTNKQRKRESKPSLPKIEYDIIVRRITKKIPENNLNGKQILWPKP